MKYISIFLSFLLFVLCFTGCNKNGIDETTSLLNQDISNSLNVDDCTNNSENVSNADDTHSDLNSNKNDIETTNKQQDNSSETSVNNPSTENTTNESQDNKVSTSELLDELKNSDVVTYYSDNPDNQYICAVANKYNVDKSCLVALIKVNATYPGGNVLQFTGERDKDGKLVFSKKTLVAIYDINETDGSIKRASRNEAENDGFTADESKKTFMLYEMLVIRKLDDMRENKVYPE